jgi:hypothetical protein
MAKNKVYIDIVVDDKGTTKKVAVNAKKLEKALEDTGRGAQTADRNLKGAAKASANGTKNFSKMAQGISGGIVPAYATLAAQIFAVSAAFHFLKSASDISNLIAGQEALGSVSGVAYKTLTQGLKEATDGQISYAEASKAAAIGTASGLSPDQLNRLGAAAKNTSIALGRDLTDSFNRLVRGVTKAEPELLDELGIILRLEEAKKNYAEQIGKTAGELNQFERSQAVANEVLDQAESKFGAIAAELDPSVTALNKFLVSFDNVINSIKQGTIKVLRPLFGFLSENTAALTVSLGLFAVPIIRSILPAFDDWKKKSDETLKSVQGNQKKWQDSLEATRKKMKALDKSAEEQKKDATKASQGVLSKIGVKADPSKPSSAASFFAGKTPVGTGDKAIKARNRAILNAEKVLANARKNINATTGKVISGVIKGATRQDIAVLEHKVAIEKKNIKKIQAIHGSAYAKMKLQVKGYGIAAVAAFQGIRASAIAAGTAVAEFGTRLLSAFSWIGLIVLAVQGFIAVWKKFDPVSDAIKEANAAAEKFTETTKTLNEELDGMIRVSNKGLLDLRGSFIQVGAALNSTDLVKKFKDFEGLSPNSEGYKEAREELSKTLDKVAQLDPRFADFNKQQEEGLVLTKENQKAYIGLANEIQNATMFLKEQKQLQKDINQGIENLITSGTAVDPTVALRTRLDFFAREGGVTEKSQLKFAKAQKKNAEEKLKGLKEEAGVAIDGLEKLTTKEAQVEAMREASMVRGLTRQQVLNEKSKKYEDIITRTTKERNIHLEVLRESTKELDAAETKSREIDKAIALARNQLEVFNEAAADLNKLFETQLSNQKAIARNRSLGFTSQGKLNNLKAAEYGIMNKLIDADIKRSLVQLGVEASFQESIPTIKKMSEEERIAALENLKNNEDITAEQKAQIINSLRALDAAKAGVVVAKADAELQRAKNRIITAKISAEKRYNVDVLQETLRMRQQELDVMNKITAAQKEAFSISQQELDTAQKRQLREAKTGFGFDFIDQGRTKLDQQIKKERAKIEFEEQVQIRIDKVKAETIKAEYALLDAKLKVSAEEARAKATELEKNDPTSKLAAALRLSANSSDTLAANLTKQDIVGTLIDNLNKGREARKAASEETIAGLKDKKEELSDMNKITNTLESSLTSGLTSAFDSVIQGTMSMKDAFRQMATDILRSLSQVIAKMLVMKAIEAASNFFFPSAQSLGQVSADGQAGGLFGEVNLDTNNDGFVNLQERTGGIVSNGREVPGFSMGGVAKGRDAGYPVTLHGTEAVVPLPNNREIPVQLLGGSGQTNNVSINVSVDSNGNAQQDSQQSSAQAGQLGQAISLAIRKELQNQKRSGGILNPYGVA